MLAIVSYFFIVIITYFVDCYLFCKINNEKFKISKKMIILIIIASFINAYLNQEYSKSIKILATNLELIFLFKALYNKSIVKTLISTLILAMFYALSEMLFVIVFINGFNLDVEIFTENSIGVIIINLVILIIIYGLFKIKFIVNFTRQILNWYKDNKYINTFALFTLALMTLTCLLYPISIKSTSISETFIFSIFLVCTIIFVTGFFNEKSENNRLSEEYDQLIDYLKIYENEINEKSKIQHEFKNQLVIIREMATSKKTKEYITNLIGEDEKSKNEILLKSLKDFPNGGLKGLVYYKLNRLPEDAEVHVNIGSNIKQNIWNKINLNDLSKIIGILLDNSIDAVKEENNKYIVLDLDKYKDEVIFTVSNSCTKKIDFEKIDQEGYSTKGTHHGYGLPLLNDIIRKNDKLRMTRELNGIMFSTKIYIKIK